MMQQLYRHYDKAGILLYVGVSTSALKRLSEHKETSYWFFEITSVTIERFEDRKAVLLAEREAIIKENPVHNLKRPSVSDIKKSQLFTEESKAEESRKELVKKIVQFKVTYSLDDVAEITGITIKRIKEFVTNNKMGFICVGERPGKNGIIKKYRVTGWQLIDFIENMEASGGIPS